MAILAFVHVVTAVVRGQILSRHGLKNLHEKSDLSHISTQFHLTNTMNEFDPLAFGSKARQKYEVDVCERYSDLS
jgi:hypothetical protein